MRRTILIDQSGSIVRQDALFEIDLGSTSPVIVAAELQLLAMELAERTTLVHSACDVTVSLEKATVSHRGEATISGEHLAIRLSTTELGYWLAFFLRYYRDGMAEVDHIDLEADLVGEADAVVDVRMRVPRWRPAVTEEEARRRLGE